MAINAQGGVHNATCHVCGASLTHVYYLNGQPIGADCLETKMGLKVNNIRAYIDSIGNVEYERLKADRAAQKAAQESAAAVRTSQVAEITASNQWLIDIIEPSAQYDNFGYALNFFGSIVRSLQQGTKASELPNKAAWIIAKHAAYGLRGSKRDDAMQAIVDRIYGES